MLWEEDDQGESGTSEPEIDDEEPSDVDPTHPDQHMSKASQGKRLRRSPARLQHYIRD